MVLPDLFMNTFTTLLIAIDSWLIDAIFQPLSNAFQRLTGKDNFFLAYTCGFINLACNLYGNSIARKFHFDTVLSLLIFITMLMGTWMIQMKYQHDSYKNANDSRAMNQDRIQIRSIVFRIGNLSFNAFMFYAIFVNDAHEHPEVFFYYLGVASWTCNSYFNACTPLPPGKSRIKKWITSFGTFIKSLVPEPHSPNPAPA